MARAASVKLTTQYNKAEKASAAESVIKRINCRLNMISELVPLQVMTTRAPNARILQAVQ